MVAASQFKQDQLQSSTAGANSESLPCIIHFYKGGFLLAPMQELSGLKAFLTHSCCV